MGPMKEFKIAEGNIKFVEFSKCLGVFIDNKLSWGKQISAFCSPFNSKLSLIRKLSYLPPETLEALYYKIIILSVTYCLSIWGLGHLRSLKV